MLLESLNIPLTPTSPCMSIHHGLKIYSRLTTSRPGGGFLVQRSIRGRAAEMGLKITLLV